MATVEKVVTAHTPYARAPLVYTHHAFTAQLQPGYYASILEQSISPGLPVGYSKVILRILPAYV